MAVLFHLQTNLHLLYQTQSVWNIHTVPFLCCSLVSAWNYKRQTEGVECIDMITVLRYKQKLVLMCSPVKHFQCLEAASWLCADPSQSRVETPPPRCEWGNTWSQLLQPGSWAGFPAASRRQLFIYSSVRNHACALDSALPHFQESHLPRKLYPQSTSLSPPAASHWNFQEW